MTMAGTEGSGSPEVMETTEVAPKPAEHSSVTPHQVRAMKQILDNVCKYREKNGNDPSKLFQKKVNKRIMPDYYDVIKEPTALSTLRGKLLHKSYASFAEYVRDAALIVHNAQTYNRPESGAFQDSIVVKRLFQGEFRKLVDEKVITEEEARFPDLGDLPPVEDLPPMPEEEEEEEDEDDDDEEEEDEEDAGESDEEGGKRKRRKGPRSAAAISKREGGVRGDSLRDDARKRRGRPPKVDTPMETRIKNILRGIRRIKGADGQLMYHHFEKLPDKAEHPHYYVEIKVPLAIEQIKRKTKRKKYNSVDHFLGDMDIMFNNCKSYNEPDSNLYQDAVALQKQTHRLASAEKARPDADFAMEEGRLPLPDGIIHAGEVWKVGDWVHLQNPNDVTKPIIAQVYRTWQDLGGEKWINACWYYRPEQTVHQYEKHFFPGEVVKTGQYRDHRVEEIIDRCFVMFITRFSRGRPRGFSDNKEVYVCESRYNEEKHKMNKIKTWASCLPDEVRDKDYEMDLFDRHRRIKKIPSPILHLLKDDEGNKDPPKPTWGAENAPPIVGAVYKGPRDENQSPPPEPTPSPPPQPPPPVVRPTKLNAFNESAHRRDASVDGLDRPAGLQASHTHSSFSSPQIAQYPQHSASPVPTPQPQQYAPTAPSAFAAQSPYSGPANRYAPPAGGAPLRVQEVFRLPENANQLIPGAIRDQYQQDEHGHVLFFSAPPADTLPPVKDGTPLMHSAKYLAAKLRAQMEAKQKRKAAGLDDEAEDTEPSEPPRSKVKQEHEMFDLSLRQKISETREQALGLWIKQMQNSTDRIYQDIYGEHWEAGKSHEHDKLRAAQREETARQLEFGNSQRDRKQRSMVSLEGSGIFKDDYEPMMG